MTHPGCRISRVRHKESGFTLHRVCPEQDVARINLMREIHGTLDGYQDDGTADIAGFAFVVWGSDNTSSAVVRCGARSRVPAIAAPDFIRNRLLASKIEDWLKE